MFLTWRSFWPIYGSFDVTLAEIESRKADLSTELQESYLQWQRSFLILNLMRLWAVLFLPSIYGETFLHLSRFYREGKEEFCENVLSLIRKDMLTPLKEKIQSEKDAVERASGATIQKLLGKLFDWNRGKIIPKNCTWKAYAYWKLNLNSKVILWSWKNWGMKR